MIQYFYHNFSCIYYLLSHTYVLHDIFHTMSGEPMAPQAINKINGKLKFLYREKGFLTPWLRRMLCNALIQPHCDFACSTWYPNFNVKLEKNCK